MRDKILRQNYEEPQHMKQEEILDIDPVTVCSKQYLDLIPVGVKLQFDEVSDSNLCRPISPLKYCEAVNQVMASSKDLLLRSEDISCPAAKEVLGFIRCGQCSAGECFRELTLRGRFNNEQSVIKALTLIPKLEKEPKSLLLSTGMRNPDIYIFYLHPDQFMMIIQAYQRLSGDELLIEVSSVMPVCGNCTVRPYVTNRICISFGCPDSRNYGGITQDKFAVGIPLKEARLVMRSLEEMLATWVNLKS